MSESHSTEIAVAGPATDHEIANFLRHHEVVLVRLDDAGNEDNVWITRLPFLVGRGRRSPSPVHDDTVSREHAEILLAGGRLHLVDLRSSNGSFLNGQLVERATLADGDHIHFGSAGFQILIQERRLRTRLAVDV
jgi:pSer/pThr/pTyr-binding forkhead associated (FHA) protein